MNSFNLMVSAHSETQRQVIKPNCYVESKAFSLFSYKSLGKWDLEALKSFLEKNTVGVTFQCLSKCIPRYLVEARNLLYLSCLLCNQLVVVVCMVFIKKCYDRLVMSATGRGMRVVEQLAVCLPFLDPGMVLSSNIGVPGKRRTSNGRCCT